MTILVSVPERNFPAQDNIFAFTVDPALTTITVTLDHPDWPEGECIKAEVWWNGIPGGQFSTGGGVVRDRDGNPTGGNTQMSWTCHKPREVANGEVHVQVMQNLRTAILVEWF